MTMVSPNNVEKDQDQDQEKGQTIYEIRESDNTKDLATNNELELDNKNNFFQSAKKWFPSKARDSDESNSVYSDSKKVGTTINITNVDLERSESFQDESGIFHHDQKLKKGLQQRHMQIITLVAVFGTGLFLSSGGTLSRTGPLGMVLSYLFVGIVVGLNQMAIAETAALMPVTGATVRHAEHFIDDALGFTYGWISVYSGLMPGELSATSVIMTYWTDLNSAIFITIFGLIIIASNSVSIRLYGEIEFFFGMLKILLVMGLIISGLVIDLGGVVGHRDRIGFRYWKNPGLFAEHIETGSLGKFLGFWSAISSVVYAYGGVQTVGLLAGECQYPRRAIFTASKRVFYRVLIMYMSTVFVLTLIVPYNDKSIASSSGNATSSPFVVAMKRAGIKGLPHIINAVVLTSAFSAANLDLVKSSRTLFALAARKQAPQVFLRTTKRGVPYVGIIFSALFIPLAYMSVSSSSSTVFSWFQNLASSNLLFGWILISANHIFMTRAMKVQGIPRSKLPHSMRFAPIAAWISGFWSVIFLLTGGYANFIHGKFEISSFFTSYFIIPLSIGLFTFWKVFKKTKWLKPEEVDLESLFRDVEENPEPPAEPLRGWKILTLLWA